MNDTLNGVPAPRIRFTLYTDNEPVGKTIILKDGKPAKSAGAGLWKGKFETIEVTNLTALQILLDSLTASQCVAWGVCSKADTGRTTVKAKEDTPNGKIARISSNYAWNDGPGVMLLDYDAREGHPALSVDAWRAAVSSACPSLTQAGMLTRPSTSSGVAGLPDGGGLHSYVIVDKASDIPEIGKRLNDLLWASGHGYIKVSDIGGALTRTAIDTSVWQPERLDYAGPPELGKGVVRTPPASILHDGPMLRLADIPPLTDDQVEQKDHLVRRGKADAAKEMDDKAAAWEDKRVAQGMSSESAKSVTRTARGDETVYLPLDTPVRLEDGKMVTVGDIVESPSHYHDKRCFDPLYGGDRAKATILTKYRQKGDLPKIASKNHGDHTYFLGPKAVKADKPKAAPKPRASGWDVREGKVFVKKKDNEGNEFSEFVCSELKILARTEDVSGRDIGGNDGVLVEMQHQREKDTRQLWLAMDRVHSAPELKLDLVRAGLYVNTAVQTHTALLSRYINENLPDRWIDASEKTGWCKGSFVLPHETVGTGEVVLQSTGARAEYAPGGTLEGWQETAKLSAGNPLVVLALCAAFAAPLLKELGISGSGLHLFGDSSSGKSTCAEFGASVWGGESYTHKWNATANGLEALALNHNDTMLYLDEIARAAPDVLAGSIYALADGKGRERADIRGRQRPAATWRVFVLSTGEKTADTYCARAGVDLDAGQDIRMLNVEALATHGAFDTLHGYADGEGLALAIKSGIARNYGHAGRAFVARLIQEASPGDLQEAHTEVRKSFDAIPGQESRGARIFATLALAGELATDWGIVPWADGEATRAAVQAFRTWKGDRAATGGQGENARILEKVAACINTHGGARFQKLDTDMEVAGVRDQMGYWDTDGANRRFYLFTAAGLKAATPGYDKKRVIRALTDSNAILKTESKGADRKPRADVKTWVASGYERLYYVAPWMLSGDMDLAMVHPTDKAPLTIVKG